MTDRRSFMMGSLAALAARTTFPNVCFANQQTSPRAGSQGKDTSIDGDEWMKRAVLNANTSGLGAGRHTGGPIIFGRFVERMYFLRQPMTWSPEATIKEQQGYPSVLVPAGFVTDLASIPRVFYSLLPPDGPYTVPAIVHDYLYWMQTTSKDQADNIFNFSMLDFKIGRLTRGTIYQAVHLGGQSAWNSNANLKAHGEKRILSKFPTDPTTLWSEWKKDKMNFA